jgi:hypothetical protein
MSAQRKQEAVLRVLRGEDLELVSRELGVTAAALSGWLGSFLAAGAASLKSRPARHPRHHPPPSSASVMRMTAIHAQTERKRQNRSARFAEDTAPGSGHGGFSA